MAVDEKKLVNLNRHKCLITTIQFYHEVASLFITRATDADLFSPKRGKHLKVSADLESGKWRLLSKDFNLRIPPASLFQMNSRLLLGQDFAPSLTFSCC